MGLIDQEKCIICIKGAGEMATGVAVRLKKAGFSRIFMLEIENPLAVRRTVSFCEAILEGISVVEDIEGVNAVDTQNIFKAWDRGQIAIAADPKWDLLIQLRPDVVVDAIIAKKNLGTTLNDAPLVIGLGPGFTAKVDVHRVIETMRGHDLGRVIEKGAALADTGIPGPIGGHTVDRVLRAPCTGVFSSKHSITQKISAGEIIGSVEGKEVVAKIDGILRGLVRSGTTVRESVKIGDIDPRGHVEYCSTVSDKSRAIGGAVLEAILGARGLRGDNLR